MNNENKDSNECAMERPAYFDHKLPTQLACTADTLRLLPGSEYLVERLATLERLAVSMLEHSHWLQEERNKSYEASSHIEKTNSELRLKLDEVESALRECRAADNRTIAKLHVVANQMGVPINNYWKGTLNDVLNCLTITDMDGELVYDETNCLVENRKTTNPFVGRDPGDEQPEESGHA